MPFRASWSLAPGPPPALPSGGLSTYTIPSTLFTGLGTDISAIPDLNWTPKTGLANLGEALTRRLGTPRGQLFYDPDYGYDLRDWINCGFSPTQIAQIAAAVVAECLKDERVVACACSVQPDSNGNFQVGINATTTLGPFPLVLNVDAITGVTMLENP